MPSSFKSRLKAGEVLLGSVITSGAPEAVEAFSRLGFDWFWIDMEHAALGLQQTQNVLIAIGDRAATLVRVPWNDDVWIKQIVDLGGDGIIVPEVRSAEQARKAVAACLYPPAGIRSTGFARPQGFGLNFADYVKSANENMIVVLQVENIKGVEEIEAITDVEGVDAILIGPYDLSASLGLIGQVGHPDVQAAISRIKEVCSRKGIPVGAFAVDAEIANKQIEGGISLIGISNDILFMSKAAKQALAEVKKV